MSYRQPAFMVEHPIAALALSALDDNDTISDADKRSMIDYRKGDITSTIDARVDIDFGGTPAVVINRLVIPAGHNLSGLIQRVWGSATFAPSDIASPAVEYVATADVIDVDLSTRTPDGTERYWRWIPVSAVGTIDISEFWLGEYQQLTGAVTPDFESSYVYQQTETAYPGGLATVELAPPRRTFTLTVRNIDPAGSDYAVLESVMTTGRSTPFWYWPPDTEMPGPFLVQLSNEPKREQDSAAPSVRMRYRVDLEIEETAL